MVKDIHPKYYPDAKVTCACGNQFTVGSTMPKIEVEICSACHPFFTGKEKLIDSEGRVEKFEKRRQEAEKRVEKQKQQKEKERRLAEQEQKEDEERPKTLQEMVDKVKEQSQE